jgi:hypothetical protein
MATTVNSITNLDFDQVKADLKAYLKGQNQFKDYDFEGSNMSVLLDILAYNTYQNNFYTNMAISEMFLDSSQLRDSVISHAKSLNYLPRSYTSSVAKIAVRLSVAAPYPATITIPAKTKFIARCGNKTYTFYSTDAVSIPNVNNSFVYNNLEVYEGSYITEAYSVTNINTQRFVISNKNVDTNSIRVTVKATSTDTTGITYMPKSNIFGVGSLDNVFYVQPYFDDKYEIGFGQNVFGNVPTTGNVVLIEYRMTVGSAANGITSMAPSGSISGYQATVSLNSTSAGGSDIESIESIKYFAPKSIQIQDRAITKSDFEIILKNKFPEIQAALAYGGEERDPPQYGRVIVAVDTNNAYGLSSNDKNKYYNYLKDRTALGIEPIIEAAEFMYLYVTSNVYYNINVTDLSPVAIKDLVANSITKYSTNNLSDFKKTFRYSNFTSTIDNSNVSILSNDTSVQAILAINPTLNVNNAYSLEFKNQLIIDHPLTTGELVNTHKPAIKSSTFTYAGKDSAFIQDDGLGKLQILQTTNGGFIYLNDDIGSVDYMTGKVTIKALNISAYEGADLRIYGRTVLSDIVPPNNRIITIRPEDVLITVYGVAG